MTDTPRPPMTQSEPVLTAEEIEELVAELKRERRDHGRTMRERDEAQEWADRLAYALGGPGIGEHSNLNNPWQNALEDPLLAAAQSPVQPVLSGLDDLERRIAFAMEARDVQRGGSPHITPDNRFYREQAAALMALMPPPATAPAADEEPDR